MFRDQLYDKFDRIKEELRADISSHEFFIDKYSIKGTSKAYYESNQKELDEKIEKLGQLKEALNFMYNIFD